MGRRSFCDPFFDEGNVVCRMLPRLGVYDFDSEELCHVMSEEHACDVPGCTAVLSSVMELEMHYNSNHRFMCCTCRKHLPSAHFLDLHVEESHDSYFAVLAARKPMFRCFVDKCSVRFKDSSERAKHCMDVHAFPVNFPWLGNFTKSKSKKGKPALQESPERMDFEENSLPECTNVKQSGGSAKIKETKLFRRGGKAKTFNRKAVEEYTAKESPLDSSEFCSDLTDSLPNLS